MTILVTGATGSIGRQILDNLAGRAGRIRALTRTPDKADFAAGIKAVGGDLADVASMRVALQGVDTLFVLVPNLADEFIQAMLMLVPARDAGIKGVVYLSVYRGAGYADVPHFAGKATVERMIADGGLAATVLRPAYYIQSDIRQKGALDGGVYAMPVGQQGVSMIDTRDIGRAAARDLLRRERADTPLPPVTYPLVGPDALTGDALAAIWSDVLGRPIRYGGDDLDAMEQRLAATGPSWLAYDLRLMMHRYQTDGAVATAGEIAATADVLGRTPRSYRAFAGETAAQWAAA